MTHRMEYLVEEGVSKIQSRLMRVLDEIVETKVKDLVEQRLDSAVHARLGRSLKQAVSGEEYVNLIDSRLKLVLNELWMEATKKGDVSTLSNAVPPSGYAKKDTPRSDYVQPDSVHMPGQAKKDTPRSDYVQHDDIPPPGYVKPDRGGSSRGLDLNHQTSRVSSSDSHMSAPSSIKPQHQHQHLVGDVRPSQPHVPLAPPLLFPASESFGNFFNPNPSSGRGTPTNTNTNTNTNIIIYPSANSGRGTPTNNTIYPTANSGRATPTRTTYVPSAQMDDVPPPGYVNQAGGATPRGTYDVPPPTYVKQDTPRGSYRVPEQVEHVTYDSAKVLMNKNSNVQSHAPPQGAMNQGHAHAASPPLSTAQAHRGADAYTERGYVVNGHVEASSYNIDRDNASASVMGMDMTREALQMSNSSSWPPMVDRANFEGSWPPDSDAMTLVSSRSFADNLSPPTLSPGVSASPIPQQGPPPTTPQSHNVTASSMSPQMQMLQLQLQPAYQNVPSKLGIVITNTRPYRVLKLQAPMDANGTVQGDSEYLNEPIIPGDRIVAINAQHLESLSLAQVLDLVSGPSRTMATLQLMRRDGAVYTVHLCRQ
jgi:hypothetical protein